MRAIPAILALLGSLLLASQARAEGGPRISPIRVTVDGDRVLATFALRDGFDDRLRSRIESGLPTSVLYRIELYRERKRWWDLRLQQNTLEVTAMYDAVARVYNVHFKLDNKLIESRTVHDLKAVEETMTLIGPVPVFQITGIPHGWRLLLKVAAEMGSRTILSVIPATISTDWKDSPKFRAPNAPNAPGTTP
jgi:Domain of unknown function (DUF4390)